MEDDSIFGRWKKREAYFGQRRRRNDDCACILTTFALLVHVLPELEEKARERERDINEMVYERGQKQINHFFYFIEKRES